MPRTRGTKWFFNENLPNTALQHARSRCRTDTHVQLRTCCVVKFYQGPCSTFTCPPRVYRETLPIACRRRNRWHTGPRARCHIFSRTTHPELPRSRFQDQTSTLNTARPTEIARYKGSALAQIISLLFLSAAFSLRVLCSLLLGSQTHTHTGAERSCP